MSNIFKKGYRYKIVIHLFFILMCLTFVVPMILVISISFSSEASVTAVGAGYSLIPKEFSLEAYQLAFANPKTVTYGYIVTISQSFLGTFLSCIVMGMVAYPLSRSNFAYKGVITFIVFFTMLFGGGMIPTYIVYTQFYGLRDNFLVYILPGLAGGAYYTLIVRTFFKGLPESLFESAKIDGARADDLFPNRSAAVKAGLRHGGIYDAGGEMERFPDVDDLYYESESVHVTVLIAANSE